MRDSRSQQSSSSSSTSSLLRELCRALSDLTLIQARIHSVRDRLSRRSRRSSSPTLSVVSFEPSTSAPSVSTPIAAPVADPPLLHGGSIRSGDHVRILNPRPGQQAFGIASFSRGDFIYVLTANGSRIHRYEKNLQLIPHIVIR